MQRNTFVKGTLVAALVAGSLAFVGARATAQTVALSTLTVPGASITCGDKVFDMFTYSATGDMPTATNVNVTCRFVGPQTFGLRFQGGFADFAGGGSSDALISYRVTSLGGKITSAALAGNPSVVAGTGAMSVQETFTPDAPNSMSIFQIKPGASQFTDNTAFAGGGFQSLHVQKDILGSAGTGFASMSFVDQDFTQNVPEGSSLLMLLPAMLPLGIIIRKRRAG